MDATKPHLATPEELDALRSNPSPSSPEEFHRCCLELRRLRQEEEARLAAQQAKAAGKRP